jgi:flagellar assembly factor FliW
MSTTTFESTRFGTLEVSDDAVVAFPKGLIGLEGERWALVSTSDDSAFLWLHSLQDPALALPVTNPWVFFADYAVELSDDDSARIGCDDPSDIEVYVTVRAGERLEDFSANLRAPLVLFGGRGHQVINEAKDAPVRAKLFAEGVAEQAA